MFFKYGGLRYKILLIDDYVDGKWYLFFKEERNRWKMFLILNNNWISGNLVKIKRVKVWGYWFLIESGYCDFKNIERIVD